MQLSTSNQSEGLSVHKIDVEKGMHDFSTVMAQFGEDHQCLKESDECMEQLTEKVVKCMNRLLVIFPTAQELSSRSGAAWPVGQYPQQQ